MISEPNLLRGMRVIDGDKKIKIEIALTTLIVPQNQSKGSLNFGTCRSCQSAKFADLPALQYTKQKSQNAL
jgi:hypothetical protein